MDTLNFLKKEYRYAKILIDDESYLLHIEEGINNDY